MLQHDPSLHALPAQGPAVPAVCPPLSRWGGGSRQRLQKVRGTRVGAHRMRYLYEEYIRLAETRLAQNTKTYIKLVSITLN